jgi:hypothetical protein
MSFVALVPADARAGADRLGDPFLALQRAQREEEPSGGEDGVVRVGQAEGLFLGERVGLLAVGLGPGRVAAGRLSAQPFGDVPRIGPGPLRQLGGGGRPGRQCRVEAEAVADDDVARRERGPQVTDEAVQEVHQPVLVDRHGRLLVS